MMESFRRWLIDWLRTKESQEDDLAFLRAQQRDLELLNERMDEIERRRLGKGKRQEQHNNG